MKTERACIIYEYVGCVFPSCDKKMWWITFCVWLVSLCHCQHVCFFSTSLRVPSSLCVHKTLLQLFRCCGPQTVVIDAFNVGGWARSLHGPKAGFLFKFMFVDMMFFFFFLCFSFLCWRGASSFVVGCVLSFMHRSANATFNPEMMVIFCDCVLHQCWFL